MGRILSAVNPSPSPGRTLPWIGKWRSRSSSSQPWPSQSMASPRPTRSPRPSLAPGSAPSSPTFSWEALTSRVTRPNTEHLPSTRTAPLPRSTLSQPPATTPLHQPTKSLLPPTMHLLRLTTHLWSPRGRSPAQLRCHQLLQVLGDARCGSTPDFSGPDLAVSRLSALVPGLITLFAFQPEMCRCLGQIID